MTDATTREDLLPGFRGDLAWLHARESHAGRPYWPKGLSGVTVDPGLDLHHADWSLVERVLGPVLKPGELARLKAVRHMTGAEAMAVTASPKSLKPNTPPHLRKIWGSVRDILISRETAAKLLPKVADPYWRALVKRFPGLLGAPPAAHTALLSLGYNRGAGNKHLAVLRPWIAAGDWGETGREIKRMQQDHPQTVIRERRQLEGNLILSALEA